MTGSLIAPVYSARHASPEIEDALRVRMAPIAARENDRLRRIMDRATKDVSERCRKAALKRGDAQHQRWLRRTVVRMACDGATIAQIAAAVGRHETRIINIISEERAKGAHIPKREDRRKAKFAADKEKVPEMRAAGMTNRQIAEALHTSKARVEKMVGALRREGRL